MEILPFVAMFAILAWVSQSLGWSLLHGDHTTATKSFAFVLLMLGFMIAGITVASFAKMVHPPLSDASFYMITSLSALANGISLFINKIR